MIADPDRLAVEGARHGLLDLGVAEALLAQASHLDVAVLAEHLHEAAERDPVQAVARSAPHDRGDARREADPELLDRDAGPLGDDEVAELVDQDQDDQDAKEGGDGADDLHQAPTPRPRSLRSAVRTSASRAAIASSAGLVRRAPAVDRIGDGGRDLREGRCARQERLDRDLVGRVQDRAAVAARLGGRTHGVVRRIGARRERLEVEAPPLRGHGASRGRRQALGEGEGVLDGEAHVGESQLGLVRAVGELDERVHDALGVDHGVDLRVRKSIQPFGLDDLERLVDQRGRVDRDLRPHPPGGVRERLARRSTAVERRRVAAAERSPAGGQHQTRHEPDPFPDQALPDGRVLAVDRSQQIERIAAKLVEQRRDEVAAGDEGLLVGERHATAGAQCRQDGRQRRHAGGGDDHELDAVERRQLGRARPPPSDRRPGRDGRRPRTTSARHGQAASCSAIGVVAVAGCQRPRR